MTSGWKTERLTDVAELRGRIGWKGLTAKEYTQEGPYFLSVHSLNYGDYANFRHAFHISQQRYDESPEIMLQTDDVLICKDGAGIGKVGIVGPLPGPSTINSSLLLIRAKSNVLPKYLFHLLQSPYFQAIVQSRLEGATTPHLYQRDIATFPVHLPSFEEQRRIVAILDEALDGIRIAFANAEQCRGAAKEIVDSEVRTILDEAARRYPSVELGGVVDILDSRRRPITKSDRLAGPYPYYGATGIQDHVADYLFEEPLVLLGEDGAKWGSGDRSAFAVSGRIWVNNHAHVLRPRRDRLTDSWLIYALNSFDLAPYVTGVTVPKLNQARMREIVLPIPPLARQVELVDRLDRVMEKTEELVRIYDHKLAALAELKQSLLARAFSGELTREPVAA